MTKEGAPKITLFTGDDYCIIWKGEKQVFCYHGSIHRCCQEICEALGAEFELAEVEEGEFEWGAVDGKTLAEFMGEVSDNRAKAKQKEIAKLRAELDAKESELKDIRRSRPKS